MQSTFVLQTEDKTEKAMSVLSKLNNLYGIGNTRKILEKYIQYLSLKESGKITLGNNNIIIKCENLFFDVEPILDVIKEILSIYNEREMEYRYIDIRNVDSSEDIKILDCNKTNIYNSFNRTKLLNYISANMDGIFIFVLRERNDYQLYYDMQFTNFAYWEIETGKEKENLNDQYISELLENNGLEVDKDCRIFEYFKKSEYSEINAEIFRLIIECHTQKINKITDENLEKLRLFNLDRVCSSKEKADNEITGYQQLNKMIGLNDVKEQIRKIVNYIKVNKCRNKNITLHMVFEGNPRLRKDRSK